jgi:hypothetical protein
MSARIKGSALKSSIDYIRSTYGEATWSAVLSHLNEEQRSQVAHIMGGSLFPVTLAGAIFTAFVALELKGDLRSAESALRKMGRHAADEQLGGVYSLFVRFTTPEKALARIAGVVQGLYEGATTELIYVEGEKRGTVHIRGLGDFPYAAPRLCGWAERALERSGGKAVRAVERSWTAGQIASDDLIFDVVWA